MSAHTPGPWESFNTGIVFAVKPVAPSSDRIAECRYKPMLAGVCEGFDVAQANACLIAAAPELCAIARDSRCPECGRLHEIRHLRNVNCEWCDRRAAAIAKAEGKA